MFAQAVAIMTRLNRDAAQAAVAAGVRAATDVTGFGLLGHPVIGHTVVGGGIEVQR